MLKRTKPSGTDFAAVRSIWSLTIYYAMAMVFHLLSKGCSALVILLFPIVIITRFEYMINT